MCPLIEYMEYKRYARNFILSWKDRAFYKSFIKYPPRKEGFWRLTEKEEEYVQQKFNP